jgi:hypothetical protein
MILSKELRKRGKSGFIVVDLDITQEGSMTIRVVAGPVTLEGKEYVLAESSDYLVDEDPAKRWIGIHLVERLSDGECVVFMDEDYMGEPGYDFSKSIEYKPFLKLGEVTVPAGATTLDDAPFFIRRWIDEDAFAAENPKAESVGPTSDEIATRQAVIDKRRADAAAAVAEVGGE